MRLLNSYLKLRDFRKDYYWQFTYNSPLMVTVEQNKNMKFIQECLHKSIIHLAQNYENYSNIMPISGRTAEVLEICKPFSYKPGTYRTDFILTEQNEIKIIEITCRFALNGFIRSGFVNSWAEHFASKNGLKTKDQYSGFFHDLERYFEGRNHIILLKNDRFNEGKYLIPLFAEAGYQVSVFELDEIAPKAEQMRNAVIITQLRHDELFSLPNHALESMMQGILLNDLRTALLVHDKRFFALLWDDHFRTRALGKAHADQFKAFLTPTFTPLANPQLWQSLFDKTDDWIVKPSALGMGIGITASPLLNKQEWVEALTSYHPLEIVFQPFMAQRRFSGYVGNEKRENDYIAGTLLFFQDGYYGPGLFRASSHPITNKGDDRKIATLALDTDIDQIDPKLLNQMMFL